MSGSLSAMRRPALATAPEERARPGEPMLTVLLRSLVMGATAAVLAWPLATGEAVFAAWLGGTLAAWLGSLAAASPLRSSVLLAGGALVAAGGWLLRRLVVDAGLGVDALGPQTALRLADAAGALLLALGLLGGLHALSVRRRAGAVLELSLAAMGFAWLVAPHRYGAVNRPFELADPILASGGDPTIVFLVLGGVAAGAITLLLLTERHLLRALLQVLVLLLLVVGVVLTTRLRGLPPAPPTGAGLGLRPGDDGNDEAKPENGKKQGGGGGGGGGGRQGDSPPRNEDMEFRNEYPRSNRQVPVAIVVLHDDYTPPSGVFYLRQAAFSQYNGTKLVAAMQPFADRDLARGFPVAPTNVEAPPPAGAFRAPVAHSVALLAEHARPFGVEAPVRFAPEPNPRPARFERVYRVESLALTADLTSLLPLETGREDWGPEQWAHYTQGPGDPRYRALAERIVDEVLPERLRDVPIARTLAIVQWLSDKGTYSLRSRHAGAPDPTAHFLFGDLTGYCVHFAHAAVFLMRALGLPARVATGYAVPDENRQGGSSLLVTGGDSHAWPEVYVRGVGWVPFDVQPRQVLDPPPPPPDQDLQRMLGELLRGENPLPPEAADELPRALDEAKRTAVRWSRLLGWLLLAVLLALYAIKLWRRLAPRLAPAERWPRLVYRAELDRLAELGLRRAPGESREAFAARLRERFPALEELTAVHVGARFGSRRAVTERDRLPELARSLRAQVRRHVPGWRRLLGLLDPSGWLRAR